MDIKEALSQLDALDDSMWTQDGTPKLEAVSELVGKKVTRQEIIDAAPKFTRENPELDIQPEVSSDVSFSGSIDEPMSPEDFSQVVLKKANPKDLPGIEALLEERVQEIDRQIEQMKEDRQKLKMSLSITRVWIKQLVPDISDQEAIQSYIKRSNEARAKKAADVAAALGGLRLSDLAKLDPRAPIDRAMSRNTSRGVTRPGS